ncbi:MAG: ATP phosphoribosyltransferase [Gammaproteobacteria bacterium]|nr:MAG: ATP phosphoribosyltransferase [Gammaproteobacteria bacterium]
MTDTASSNPALVPFDGITIALSKGRILEETLPLLAKANITLLEDPGKSRKLVFPTTRDDVRILIIRATDVPTYVEYGAADLGVAGKDVLMEHGGDGLYEPLDLKIAICKLMVAEPLNSGPTKDRPKVATKFVNVAKKYFAEKGQQVEVIKLYGSMELAPLVGLADCIVDVVDTGSTLKANGLMPTELIASISSRLVVNKAAMKMRHELIQGIINQMKVAVDEAQA